MDRSDRRSDFIERALLRACGEMPAPFLRDSHPDPEAALNRMDRLRRRVSAVDASQIRVRMRLLGKLGDLERSLGQVDAAVSHLEEALALARSLSDVRSEIAGRIRLATARFYRGEYAEAEEELRHLTDELDESSPHASFAHQHLGKCLAEQGRFEEAAACFEKALGLRVAEGDEQLIASSARALEEARQRL